MWRVQAEGGVQGGGSQQVRGCRVRRGLHATMLQSMPQSTQAGQVGTSTHQYTGTGHSPASSPKSAYLTTRDVTVALVPQHRDHLLMSLLVLSPQQASWSWSWQVAGGRCMGGGAEEGCTCTRDGSTDDVTADEASVQLWETGQHRGWTWRCMPHAQHAEPRPRLEGERCTHRS